MVYRKIGDTYLVRMEIGEEIMAALKELCRKEDIRLAEISALGATDHAVIGVYDLERAVYQPEELNGLMEIASLTGNVTTMKGETYLHLHAVLADQNHGVHAGHVNEMRIGLTCEMFVRTLPGEIDRERDEKLGINIWKI